MTIEGITISELMKETGKSRRAIETWISNHKIKPVIPEFLYPLNTLDKIKEARRGRPKKP